MIPALAGAYVASLPLLHPAIATIGPKTVVVADLVFVGLLAAVGRRHRTWLRAPWRGLILAASLPPLSIALSGVPAGAAAGAELARVAYSMAVLLLFAHLRLSSDQLDRIARIWVSAACLTCLAGLLALLAVTLFGAPPNPFAAADSPNLGPGVTRVASTTGANALALYLQPSLALCLYLMSTTSGPDRRLRYALGLLVITAVLTFSRSLVGVLLVLALAARDAAAELPWLWRRRRLLGAATAVLLVAAAAATVWAVLPLRGGRLNTSPNAYRVLHAAGARMFAARPLTGIGPGEFGRRFGEFTTPEERSTAWPSLPTSVDHDPHSTWLGWAAECGLVGLAAWGALFGFVARHLMAAPPASLPRLAGCTLAGLALSGLAVEITHLKFVWCFLGLGLSAAAAEREATAPPDAATVSPC